MNAMHNGNDIVPHFLVTHKEEEMLRQFRELDDEDQREIEHKILEIAVKYAEWGK